MAKWYKDKNGYARFKDSNRLVHRWAAKKKVGAPLRKGSVVHHKNRVKTDNRKSNLWVFSSQKAHTKTHQKDKMISGFW